MNRGQGSTLHIPALPAKRIKRSFNGGQQHRNAGSRMVVIAHGRHDPRRGERLGQLRDFSADRPAGHRPRQHERRGVRLATGDSDGGWFHCMPADQSVYRLAAVAAGCCDRLLRAAMRDLPLSKRPERAILRRPSPQKSGNAALKRSGTGWRARGQIDPSVLGRR